MNKENLQKMADYIRTIPQAKFDMLLFRGGLDRETPECNSIGCVIGHCTVLDRERFQEIVASLHEDEKRGNQHFTDWSTLYTGMVIGTNEWRWCFSAIWGDYDNSSEGAARRIEYLIKKGLPENWDDQMSGLADLSYLNTSRTITEILKEADLAPNVEALEVLSKEILDDKANYSPAEIEFSKEHMAGLREKLIDKMSEECGLKDIVIKS